MKKKRRGRKEKGEKEKRGEKGEKGAVEGRKRPACTRLLIECSIVR